VKLATTPEKVSRWNSRKKQFQEKLPEILKKLKPVKALSEQEAKELKAELKEYKQDFEKADKQISELKQQMAELAKAKDRKAVEEIRKKYSKGSVLFDELLRSAQKPTSELPGVVREALFYNIRGEDFLPDYEEWHDEPRGAVENNLMEADENIFAVNSGHPKVQKALRALRKLRDFLEELPEDFPVEEYQRKHEDLLDMTSRTFWERHHLL